MGVKIGDNSKKKKNGEVSFWSGVLKDFAKKKRGVSCQKSPGFNR